MGQIANLISSVLAGEAAPESLGPSWKADLAMPIYEEANRILAMPKDERRAEIDRHPTAIAAMVALEAKRLYAMRK